MTLLIITLGFVVLAVILRIGLTSIAADNEAAAARHSKEMMNGIQSFQNLALDEVKLVKRDLDDDHARLADLIGRVEALEAKAPKKPKAKAPKAEK